MLPDLLQIHATTSSSPDFPSSQQNEWVNLEGIVEEGDVENVLKKSCSRIVEQGVVKEEVAEEGFIEGVVEQLLSW